MVPFEGQLQSKVATNAVCGAETLNRTTNFVEVVVMICDECGIRLEVLAKSYIERRVLLACASYGCSQFEVEVEYGGEEE